MPEGPLLNEYAMHTLMPTIETVRDDEFAKFARRNWQHTTNPADLAEPIEITALGSGDFLIALPGTPENLRLLVEGRQCVVRVLRITKTLMYFASIHRAVWNNTCAFLARHGFTADSSWQE